MLGNVPGSEMLRAALEEFEAAAGVLDAGGVVVNVAAHGLGVCGDFGEGLEGGGLDGLHLLDGLHVRLEAFHIAGEGAEGGEEEDGGDDCADDADDEEDAVEVEAGGFDALAGGHGFSGGG